MTRPRIPRRNEPDSASSPVSSAEWNEWEIERYKQDTEYRKTLTEWVMSLSKYWLAFVGFILVLNAFDNSFNLSDSIMTVLLATTTADVLGLALIVLKGMFGNK